jgi:heme/copper-type cytochrome/quinol oxidase subunit 1
MWLLASPPIDFHVTDSYFVVAHFHYVLFGTIVFAVFAGVYFWFPKMTGRMLDDRLGKVHFWLTFLGFHTTFLVQHWLGAAGMARRYADYQPQDGFTTLNTVSSIGAFVLGASMLPFLWNVWKSYRIGEPAIDNDPWGHGNSLEWATTCPPPLRNFHRMPRIRSERPAWDLRHGRNDREVAGYATNMAVNPIQLQKYLSGVDYPARKQDLIERARQRGADDNVVRTLESLNRDEFNSPNDVSEAIGALR